MVCFDLWEGSSELAGLKHDPSLNLERAKSVLGVPKILRFVAGVKPFRPDTLFMTRSNYDVKKMTPLIYFIIQTDISMHFYFCSLFFIYINCLKFNQSVSTSKFSNITLHRVPTQKKVTFNVGVELKTT